MSRTWYNIVALVALVCATALAVTVIVVGGSVTDAVAAATPFSTIAVAIVGRGDNDDATGGN